VGRTWSYGEGYGVAGAAVTDRPMAGLPVRSQYVLNSSYDRMLTIYL
jgi:hypothetical protein